MPESASSYAGDVDFIIKTVTYIVGAWFVVCVVLIVIFALVFRRKPGQSAQYLPGTGKQMAWVLVPVVLVTLFDLGIDVINTPIWIKIKQDLPQTEQ
ncbi:MAG: hypothetical protein V3S29_02990, partial [bacterium]